MTANLFSKTNELIKACDTAYFGSIDNNGYPVVTTVSVIKPENLFEVYFSTGLESGKVKRLSKNNKAIYFPKRVSHRPIIEHTTCR